MDKKLRGTLTLSLVSILWGLAIISQSMGMDHVGPLTFLCVRFFLGGIVLIPVVILSFKHEKKLNPDYKPINKTLILGGIFCGLALVITSPLQQYGILCYKNDGINVGKSGFISTLYVIIIPIISIFIGKKLNLFTVFAVILTTVGMYFLCMHGNGGKISLGDWLNVGSAFGFSFHILIIDHYSPKTNGLALSCIQFLFSGICLLIPMFIFEKPSIQSILNGWLPIAYAGIISCGVAYTLQIIAQKNVNPSIAAIIMSFESVISTVVDLIINPSHVLSSFESIGCLILLFSIIFTQIVNVKYEQ